MRRLLPVLALALAVGACGGTVRSVTGGKVALPVVSFPGQILGLVAKQEDVAKQVQTVKRPYVDSVAMFSLRDGDLLRATLQVSRFNRLARPSSPRFRASVVGLLGSSKPLELKVGDTIVYSTSGNKQNVFVWFKGDGFYILGVHQDYEFPRTLLRRALNIEFHL